MMTYEFPMTAFLYNETNPCIIDQVKEYYKLQWILTCTFCLLAAFLSIGFAATFVVFFNQLKMEMKKE